MQKPMEFGKNDRKPAVIRPTCYCPGVQQKATRSSFDARYMNQRTQAIRDHWKREAFLDQLTDYTNQQENTLIRNHWEHEAEKKAFQGRIQWEMEKIQDKMEEDLEKRRKRLSDLLKQEEVKYLKEADTSDYDDPREKQQRMLDRYCELKTEKERERQQIAQEKKEQHFKLNCDELRSQMSKKLQRQAVEEGKKIIQERQVESERRNRENELYNQLWKMDCEAKKQKEEKDEEERKKTVIAHGRCIDDQRGAMNLEKLKKFRDKEEEAEIMAEQKRLMELEELCEKESKKRKREEMKKNLDSCLRAKLKMKSKEVQDDLLQDLFFLKQIMEDDNEKERNAKKKALMKEQQEYLMHLKAQMKKEDDFEREIDKLYQDELDKIWQKRQNEWDEEKQKRRQLEQGVISGIKDQIQANMDKSKQVHHLNESYAQLILKEDEENKKKDAEKLKLIKERNKRHQNELLNQIRDKEERLKEEKRQIEVEIEAARRERKEEEVKIQKLLSEMRIDHEHPYRLNRSEHSDISTCGSVFNRPKGCHFCNTSRCCCTCKCSNACK